MLWKEIEVNKKYLVYIQPERCVMEITQGFPVTLFLQVMMIILLLFCPIYAAIGENGSVNCIITCIKLYIMLVLAARV